MSPRVGTEIKKSNTDPLNEGETEFEVVDLTDETSVVAETTADPLTQKGGEKQAIPTNGVVLTPRFPTNHPQE
jgi:hypothetical protein